MEDVPQDRVSRLASLMHRVGVIIAVGTQMASERTDLEKMALYPPWKHVISLESLLQLSIVGSKIKNQLILYSYSLDMHNIWFVVQL